jgi:sorting nexin-9/18/33
MAILEKLQAAKATFYSPHREELSAARSDPRRASIFERDLPIVDPYSRREIKRGAPHVWDSAPMRPVSVAIQEGVGMLFGSSSVASLYGRGSVFGRF